MNDTYDRKVEQQIKQYENGIDTFPLPEIFHYWSHTYLRPKIQSVFGKESGTEFYASQFAELAQGSRLQNIVSIGSGDGSQEIEITRALLEKQIRGFKFIGLELNPNLVKQANSTAAAVGVAEFFSSVVFDLNKSDLEIDVDAFIAHHSLHHVLELEHLLDLVDRKMSPHGVFIIEDMIGRNGHMRWPETLAIVEALWAVLPTSKKYHHQLKRTMLSFENFDCSSEGFEGIRAQDILPLLIERFSFTKFVGAGGLIEVFVDRGFGPNYNPAVAGDRVFVDVVHAFNESLLDSGVIKPTMIFATLAKKSNWSHCATYKSQTPHFCLRKPTRRASVAFPLNAFWPWTRRS